MLNRKPLLIS